jgi:hypothetical protein
LKKCEFRFSQKHQDLYHAILKMLRENRSASQDSGELP